ncbi:unnamed protein product [Closterium sp. NIES-54]
MSFAQTCGKLHTEHRCFSCLDDAWRAEFGDEAERPCWAELLRSGFDIFALDYDAILAAMYALSVSAEGDCYLCVLPDPGIEAAALGASESALPGPVAAPCSCRLLSHQTLLWHHHLGHPSLQCLRGMHSRLLVSGLPRSLPPLPPSPAPPCLPCAEGRQRAAPHSSFPPTIAPLQTLHMDSVSSSASGSVRTFLSCVCTLTEVKNGIAERRIGLVMEVARTSMIHAITPHFLWPFAGPAPSSVSQVDPLPGTVRVEVGVDSGAARGAATGGDASRGAEPARAEPGGAESEGAESGGAEPGGC